MADFIYSQDDLDAAVTAQAAHFIKIISQSLS
jgi:hypothetical protein